MILLLFIVNTVNAIKFEDYKVICDISQNNSVHETIYLKIYNNGTKDIDKITYIIPQVAHNLNIYSDRGIKSFSRILKDGSTEINVELKNPIKTGETGNLNISFNSDIVWDKGNKKLLSVSVPAVNSNFTMIVVLPEGASIVSPAEGLLSITPQDYTIDTDGKRIYVIWKKKLNQNEKYFGATVSYAILSLPVSHNNTRISNPNHNIYYNILIIVLILFAIGLGYGIIYEKKKGRLKTKYIEEITAKKEELIKGLGDLKNRIGLLEGELKNKDSTIKKLKEENKNLIKKLEFNNNELNKLNSKIEKLEEELSNKNRIVQKLEEANVELSNKINEYVSEIGSLKSSIIELENKYNEKIDINKKLQKKIDKLADENKKYREIIAKKDNTISNLKNIMDEYEKTKSEMLMNILTDEEKMIIKLIKEHKEITQKEIVEITGMTKPKVSRIVSDLEGRGVIKKVKIGRINKLTLSDELKGWL